jgi:hypothetical protein
MQHVTPIVPSLIDKTEQLIASFRKWSPTIQKALSHGGESHTVDDIFNMCLMGQLHFYCFPDCFIVMEVVQHPRKKSYHAFLCGGRMQSVLEKEAMMMEIATALGCTCLTAAGRFGWKRVFEKQGWEFLCVTMFKEIPNGKR